MLFLALTVTACFSIFVYTSLFYVPVGLTNSVVGIAICAVTEEIKKYKSSYKKIRKKKEHNKIALLGNNLLREYNEIKGKMKNHETSVEHII